MHQQIHARLKILLTTLLQEFITCKEIGTYTTPQTSEIPVKRARGTKVKILFQGLHMTHVISVLVYNLKFCILDTPFNTAF
jgi:hypothetical protein